MLAHEAVAWLLTYLLHSTLLLGLAWLVSKPLARWSVAAEEAVWKIALVGALVTASLQVAAGWEPAAGRLTLAGPAPEAAVTAPLIPEARTAAPFRVEPSARALPTVAAEALPASSPVRVPLPAAALGLWLAGASFLLTAYAWSYLRVLRRLRSRPRVVGGTLLTQLQALAQEAGLGGPVGLSCSWRVPVPLALGLRRPEICVPPRALAGLSAEQQEGMLAHELAHLVRRDPMWLLVSHALSCFFFFQPLNWVARRRLREISEMLSDEWAVSRTGRPLSLAGCLAEVAGWTLAYRPLQSLPMPGMADRPSNLATRIRRLLDESRSPERPARRFWLGAAMLALLVLVVAAAPVVSAAREGSSDSPEASDTLAAASAELVARSSQDPSDSSALEEDDDDESAADEEAEADDDSDPDIDVDIDVDLDHLDDLDINLDGLDDLDLDLGDLDIDLGEDFEDEIDRMADSVSASMDMALDSLDGHLEDLASSPSLNEEDREKLERDVSRAVQEMNEKLQPHIEKLSREMAEKASRYAMDAETQRLTQEMARLATQLRPSEESMARLHAEVDKLRKDAELSAEDREKLAAEARRMAESMKPTEEQRRQLDQLREELRKHQRDLAKSFTAENQAEIDRATRELREEVEREMKAVREEVQRVREQQRVLEKDRRREHQEERRQKRERQRESKPDGET